MRSAVSKASLTHAKTRACNEEITVEISGKELRRQMAEAYLKHEPPVSAIKGDPRPFSGRVFQDVHGNYFECVVESLWSFVLPWRKVDITKLDTPG